jgi:hypothetical protein
LKSADAAKEADDEDSDDLETPLLEQMLKFEESAPEAQEYTERITSLLYKIGHQVGGATPLLHRASTIKRKLAIARQLARSLSPLTRDMNDEADALLRNLRVWDETVEVILGLLRRVPELREKPGARQALNAIDEMANIGIEVFAQVESAHEQIGSGRGLARELDIELRDLQRTFLRLADARAVFEKWRVGLGEFL